MITGTESRISFDSIQKLSFSTIGVALLSYCAVSPRSLPFPEYNRLFLQNLSIAWLAAIAPVVLLIGVYDGKYNNINTAVSIMNRNMLVDVPCTRVLPAADDILHDML